MSSGKRKTALELALLSPDPIIRGAALKRQELDVARKKAGNFVRWYRDQQKQASSPAIPREHMLDFVRVVTKVLLQNGAPMPLGALFTAYREAVRKANQRTHAAYNKEYFRLRLVAYRSKIALTAPKAGYWPTEETIFWHKNVVGADAKNKTTKKHAPRAS